MLYTAQWIRARITVTDNGCWEWNLGRDSLGYGRVSKVSSGHNLAHRLSYSIFCDDPEGYSICHKCDNPPCVNPEHLFKASQEVNIRDAISKGRKLSIRRVLTKEVEAEINLRLEKGETQRDIAKAVNISETYLSQFINGTI